NGNTNEATTVEESEETNSDDGADLQGEESDEDSLGETVKRELYLIDADGMVAPQTVELPKSEQVATQAMEYLVKGGPVTDILPNGFEAVLPQGTEILGLNA